MSVVLTKHKEPCLVYLVDNGFTFFLQIIYGEGIHEKLKGFFFFNKIPYSVEGPFIKIDKTYTRNYKEEVISFCKRNEITLQEVEATNYQLE